MDVPFFTDIEGMMSVIGGKVEPCKVRGELFSFFLFCLDFVFMTGIVERGMQYCQ